MEQHGHRVNGIKIAFPLTSMRLGKITFVCESYIGVEVHKLTGKIELCSAETL